MLRIMSEAVHVASSSARVAGASRPTTLVNGTASGGSRPPSAAWGSLDTIFGTLKRFVHIAKLLQAEMDIFESDPSAELHSWLIPMHGGADSVANPKDSCQTQPIGAPGKGSIWLSDLLHCLTQARCACRDTWEQYSQACGDGCCDGFPGWNGANCIL